MQFLNSFFFRLIISLSLSVLSEWVLVGAFYPSVANLKLNIYDSARLCLLDSSSSAPADVSMLQRTSAPINEFDNDYDFIQHWTKIAIERRGHKEGLEALRILSKKSIQRLKYPFFDFDDPCRRPESVVSALPGILSRNVTTAFLEKVRCMEAKGWISTNPDSVDGLPSLHLNLVSNGKPLSDSASTDDFQQGISELLALVHYPIYNELLPRVQKLLNTSNIQISDIFLRRYGHDVCEVSRKGISAHYDVFSRVTSVIAMDNVAVDGRNGLFTTLLTPNGTSNHAAMRRYFPMATGDGVVHTWDVLHGVDVEPHLDRTSLIVWFTQTEADDKATGIVSPWLRKNALTKSGLGSDGVSEFVLASALSSLEESGLDWMRIQTEMKDFPCILDLYLDSAKSKNTFALTRVGSLIEEDALDQEGLKKAEDTITSISDGNHSILSTILAKIFDNNAAMSLAMQFWFEGAIRGNPLAQRALADELMLYASENDDTDAIMLAATLFALAAQQGDDEAVAALARVIEFDLDSRKVSDDTGFHSSPIVQIAHAAMHYN